jgi:hypothetical protein
MTDIPERIQPCQAIDTDSVAKWFNVNPTSVAYGPDCHLFTSSSDSRAIPAWLLALQLMEEPALGRNQHRGHHVGRTVQSFVQFNKDNTIPIYNGYPGYQWESITNQLDNVSLIDDQPELKIMSQLVEMVFKIPKTDQHSIVTKYFHTGKINPHQDGPDTLHQKSPVVVFSYGFDTELEFTPLPGRTDTRGPFTVVIPHGSVFLMGAETNRAYKHCIQPNNAAVLKTAVKCPHRFSVIFRHCTNSVPFSKVYTKMMDSRKRKELARIKIACNHIPRPVPVLTSVDEQENQPTGNADITSPSYVSSTVNAPHELKPKKRKDKSNNKRASGPGKQSNKRPCLHPAFFCGSATYDDKAYDDNQIVEDHTQHFATRPSCTIVNDEEV